MRYLQQSDNNMLWFHCASQSLFAPITVIHARKQCHTHPFEEKEAQLENVEPFLKMTDILKGSKNMSTDLHLASYHISLPLVTLGFLLYLMQLTMSF